MLFVESCLLFVVGWLFACDVGCLLCLARASLVVCCLLVCRLLFDVCCLLFVVACCLLLVVCWFVSVHR